MRSRLKCHWTRFQAPEHRFDRPRVVEPRAGRDRLAGKDFGVAVGHRSRPRIRTGCPELAPLSTDSVPESRPRPAAPIRRGCSSYNSLAFSPDVTRHPSRLAPTPRMLDRLWLLLAAATDRQLTRMVE